MTLGALKGVPGKPYCSTQESFLCNLAKLLNESNETNLYVCIRWHPTIMNALQVNWKTFEEYYEQLCPILVSYKIFRVNNSKSCARASWNRKLREWKFQMIHIHGQWTSYIYKGLEFSRDSRAFDLPMSRRPRGCNL